MDEIHTPIPPVASPSPTHEEPKPQPFATALGPNPSVPFKPNEPVKTEPLAKPKAEDPPPTKEQHIEAIRYLIDQLLKESDEHTAAYRAVHLILPHLDAIEDKKPEKTVKW
jgi:hypothetical protein